MYSHKFVDRIEAPRDLLGEKCQAKSLHISLIASIPYLLVIGFAALCLPEKENLFPSCHQSRRPNLLCQQAVNGYRVLSISAEKSPPAITFGFAHTHTRTHSHARTSDQSTSTNSRTQFSFSRFTYLLSSFFLTAGIRL